MKADAKQRKAVGHAGARGAATMELAVVLPLLMVTLVGMVDFGRAAFEAIEVENAAHAGAFYGSRSKTYAADEDGIRLAALADVGEDTDPDIFEVESERYCECDDGSSIDCDDTCSGELPPMYVRVRVDKQFETFLDYPGITSTIDIGREVFVRVR